MRLDWELAVRGYRRFAAYPAATWAGIFTNTVFGFIQAYVLLALFETRDDIGGYDATDTLTYVWLTQAMLSTVGDLRRCGLCPADPARRCRHRPHPARASARAAWPPTTGEPLPRASSAGCRRSSSAHRLRPACADEPVSGPCFSSASCWPSPSASRFRFLYNLSAFWLLDYRGALRIAVALAAFFSGFIIPVRFFPDWLQTLAYATPFPSMLQLPVDVFVGATTGTELVATLAMQVGWAVVLFAACLAAFSRGTRKLVVQGG